MIKDDSALRDILGLHKISSSCAIGDWLRRMGRDNGLAGLDLVNRALLKTSLRHDNTHECTLDISATAIEPNLDESAEERVAWYNRRRETSENRIKELKIRFRQCAGGSIQWPEKLCVMRGN